MNRTVIKYSLVVSVLILSSACSSMFNGPEDTLTVAETHPISVDSQVVTLTIDADATTSDISGVDKARLRAFAVAYLREGHGALTVTAPSGTGDDLDGQEAASDIRKALHEAGVPWSAIAGATYRTGGGENGQQLIVSYTHYVATPSDCGDWSGLRMRDYKNLRTPNYGCATMNNYAVMIADPRDLITPADEQPGDATARVRAIEEYRAGNVTASETDQAIQTQVTN